MLLIMMEIFLATGKGSEAKMNRHWIVKVQDRINQDEDMMEQV